MGKGSCESWCVCPGTYKAARAAKHWARNWYSMHGDKYEPLKATHDDKNQERKSTNQRGQGQDSESASEGLGIEGAARPIGPHA